MRWETPNGEIWDSRFEYEVYRGLSAQGVPVRRTGEQEGLVYTAPVRNGTCSSCGSSAVATRHTYTPDLHIGDEAKQLGGDGLPASVPTTGYYVEAKGYMRADRRSLIRSFRKARPDVALRLVVQRDYRVTAKCSIVEWARKYLKCPVAVWTGGKLKWE